MKVIVAVSGSHGDVRPMVALSKEFKRNGHKDLTEKSALVIGTDIHHYQFALGTAIQFGQVGTFVEWSGLGEKALSTGMSFAW